MAMESDFNASLTTCFASGVGAAGRCEAEEHEARIKASVTASNTPRKHLFMLGGYIQIESLNRDFHNLM
jgi:hypothetical protein